jgi:phage-related protein
MAAVGVGVAEIRIHYGAEYRVLYLAKFMDAIYVLHAFEKRNRRTRRLNLEIARKRLKAVLQSRDTR